MPRPLGSKTGVSSCLNGRKGLQAFKHFAEAVLGQVLQATRTSKAVLKGAPHPRLQNGPWDSYGAVLGGGGGANALLLRGFINVGSPGLERLQNDFSNVLSRMAGNL